jgi:rfaE bifunctional protein kinase chain/domain/rfaE bifunctional protein nucleotidyltransferase chain/domain
MSSRKILSLDEIAQRSNVLREQGKRVVLCHGTFDLMHTGHIRYLQRAKKEGDVLLVTVTADEYVNKGPGRPIFNEHLRAENLAALECVDFVAINHAVTAVDALHKIKPSVYVKGSEYRSHGNDVTGNIIREQEAVEEHGGEVFYTDEITFSSSSLLNEHFGVFAPDTKCYLEQFRGKWPDREIHRMVGSLENLNVLVLGDAIIDQYHYVSPLGQTGKGNVLAVQYDTEEQFAGGSIAVANHVARFTKSVTLVAGLGDTDSHEQFIREKLQKNVTPVFSYFKNAPTVTKRRFVDSDLSKLFEVYFFHDEPMLEDAGQQTCQWLAENLPKYDVVVVADFGNGFISNEMVQILCEKSKFLAINTQINSGNRGYHVINRYPSASFVSLNEPELRLAAHNRHDPLEEVGEKVATQVDASHLAVTRGTKGVVMFDAKEKVFHKVPALSSRVIDRIGAGDAFLSLSALCLGNGLPAEVAAFVGSVAAAMDVQIVCNREPIDPVALKKYVSTLLK